MHRMMKNNVILTELLLFCQDKRCIIYSLGRVESGHGNWLQPWVGSGPHFNGSGRVTKM